MAWIKCVAILLISIGLYCWLNHFKSGCSFVPHMDLSLRDKTVLITGANTGLGLEAAKQFAFLGAHVILACRSEQRCATAAEQVRDYVKENLASSSPDKPMWEPKISTEVVDLASLSSVRDCAFRISATYPRLHYLINNAGVMSESLLRTVDGHELHFGVNHLGHFLLTRILLPHMKRSREPVRVLMVSSNFHNLLIDRLDLNDPGGTKDYHYLKAYGYSKLANILHARELARRENEHVHWRNSSISSPRVVAVSIHPGMVVTDIGRNLNSPVYALLVYLGPYAIMKSVREGVQTILHGALDPSVERFNGAYFENCSPQITSYGAQSNDDARDLWRLSEELTEPFSHSEYDNHLP